GLSASCSRNVPSATQVPAFGVRLAWSSAGGFAVAVTAGFAGTSLCDEDEVSKLPCGVQPGPAVRTSTQASKSERRQSIVHSWGAASAPRSTPEADDRPRVRRAAGSLEFADEAGRGFDHEFPS